MKRSPLLIIGLPRSGTSMIAWIFVKHGFWFGNSCYTPSEERHRKRGGYYENREVKYFMRSKCDKLPKEGGVNEYYPGFEDDIQNLILSEGYKDDGSPWMVKFGASFYPPWAVAFPECTTIIARRPVEVVKAAQRNITMEKITSHLPIMKAAEEKPWGFRVDYDAVIDGDYSQLVAPFKREGIDMDESLVREVVRPDLRHHKEAE